SSPSDVVNSMVVGSSKLVRRPITSRKNPAIATYSSVETPTHRTFRNSMRHRVPRRSMPEPHPSDAACGHVGSKPTEGLLYGDGYGDSAASSAALVPP